MTGKHRKYYPVSSSGDPASSGVLLSRFIRTWDFANPTWDSLPAGFPNLPKTGLTREEGHLLDGIRLAWTASEGRDYLIKTVSRRAAVVAAIIFVLLVGRNIITRTHYITNTVSAKTVSQVVGEAVQATMSAVFK